MVTNIIGASACRAVTMSVKMVIAHRPINAHAMRATNISPNSGDHGVSILPFPYHAFRSAHFHSALLKYINSFVFNVILACRCTPDCGEHCNHGRCVGPNMCECFYGYNQAGLGCEPICNEPCINGMCDV